MTTENLFQLSESGDLHLERYYTERKMPGYAMAAAIDCVFEEADVPIELYHANDSLDITAEEFNELVGKLAFGVEDTDGFMGTDYFFRDFDDFNEDLKELRGAATILLLVEEDHCVGLKPVGETADEWQIVGIDQVHPSAYSPGRPLQVHYEEELPVQTTGEVWSWLMNRNPGQERQVAYVYPPEPKNA